MDAVKQRIVLENVWKNGTPCQGDITLLASSIQQLSIIPSPKEDRLKPSRAPVGLRTVSPKQKAKLPVQESPRKGATSVGPPETPSKEQQRYGKGRGNAPKDDSCFEADFNAEKDFDFETNLALFDKKAVMGEIGSGKQQGPPASQAGRTVSNFRHDENVLETAPPMYRQIHLPISSPKEFLTGRTSSNL